MMTLISLVIISAVSNECLVKPTFQLPGWTVTRQRLHLFMLHLN